MNPTIDNVTEALKAVIDPGTNSDFVSTRRLKNLAVEADSVHFTIELGYPAGPRQESIRALLAEHVLKLPGVKKVDIAVKTGVIAHAVQNGVKLLPGVKNIIAVASGKGGVGKSTTAANLALALASEGAAVGILDADIYGPSLPLMLGLSDEKPNATEDEKAMQPLVAHGLQVMSMGFLAGAGVPMVWRAPMAVRALTQMLTETRWVELDYLIIDLPPGTGDIQLSLAQNVPVTGAVIVTTPQDLALIDVTRSVNMFEKVKVPILGVVENMSLYICPNCGHEEHVFGSGGGLKMCKDANLPFLGALPLALEIRQEADSGRPTVVAEPQSRIAEIYREIARKVAIAIANTPRDLSHKFPHIVVKRT